MKILILGGTMFLGRAIVDAARLRGHDVTIFNRGKSAPDIFPDVHQLRGNRMTDQSALQTGTWDVVIDTSGQFPRTVREAASILADRVERYVFVSTLSVYSDDSIMQMDESGPLCTTDAPDAEILSPENYGALKVLCEQAAESSMPGRVCVVRPGLIVGPFDRSDRFTYWPVRVARGGDVLAPGRPSRPIQFIDVRDLAEWMITLTEQKITGVFNATGYDRTVTMEELLNVCKQVSASDARFKWIDDKKLLAHDVMPWMGLPLWLPEDDESSKGFFFIDASKAMRAGLRFRPLEETVRATLAWHATRPADHQWRAGISAEVEKKILSET